MCCVVAIQRRLDCICCDCDMLNDIPICMCRYAYLKALSVECIHHCHILYWPAGVLWTHPYISCGLYLWLVLWLTKLGRFCMACSSTTHIPVLAELKQQHVCDVRHDFQMYRLHLIDKLLCERPQVYKGNFKAAHHIAKSKSKHRSLSCHTRRYKAPSMYMSQRILNDQVLQTICNSFVHLAILMAF